MLSRDCRGARPTQPEGKLMSRRLRLGTALAATATTAALIAAPPMLASGVDATAAPAPGPGYDILFVRHAHTTYPVPEEELSPTGIVQAAALVERLADEPIRSVDSSIMLRAFQTADGVAADHDVPVLADEDIREVEFDLDGIPQSQWTAHYLPILTQWLHGEERDNGFGAESYDDVQARWDRWWDDYVREHRNDKGAGVVVAHGGVLALMLPATCSNEVTAEFSLSHILANTGMVKAHLSPNGRLECTEWNGVAVPSAS